MHKISPLFNKEAEVKKSETLKGGIMASKIVLASVCISALLVLDACGRVNSAGIFGGRSQSAEPIDRKSRLERLNPLPAADDGLYENGRLTDLFAPNNDDRTINVNKYLWTASLDVLSFLPVESADPFGGVIVFGLGRAPGSSQAYRATIRITNPGLSAENLRVAVQTRRGPASAETQRRIEDAILSRARQLRIADARL